MKLLVSFRHRKAVQPFALFVDTLVERGHAVTVAVHERDEKIVTLFARADRLNILTLPDARRDAWSETAELMRSVRDVAQYLKGPYRGAGKLRRRVFERLLKQLAVPHEVASGWSGDTLVGVGDDGVSRIERALAHVESAMPADDVTRGLVARVAPDAVLATPLVHFGGSQVEVVKAAQSLGVPVGMLLFSWDNLSTKGALHARPDHLFVWNARQRDEAETLHGVPPDRVTITGAPRFDRFFALRSLVAPDVFRRSLGVDSRPPVILYLCSSRLVVEKEINFLRQWVRAIRRSSSRVLAKALLVVRPHPDLTLTDGSWMGDERLFRWDGRPEAELRARVLFGDERTIHLTSDYGAPEVLFECLTHANAVVGLNTSAEIEAGIVGRPVFTIDVGEAHADGQASTLHFHYLTEAQGGFVRVSPTLEAHVAALAAEIEAPRAATEWQAQVAAFVRPCGWDQPAGEVLADAIEHVFGPSRPRERGRSRPAAEAVAMPRRPAGEDAPPGARRIAGSASTLCRVVDADVELWAVASSGAPVRQPASTRQALRWLRDQVAPGQVVCDLTAGTGLFAVTAARLLGSTVLALETNLVALYELWQNVLVNGCDGLVVPLPFRAGVRAVLGVDRFERFAADAARLAVRQHMWREHDPGHGHDVLQPVMAMPLHWAIDRLKLPPPRAIRVALGDGDDELLKAIESLNAETRLHAVVLEGDAERLAAATRRLAHAGFVLAADSAAGRPDVLGYNRAAPA